MTGIAAGVTAFLFLLLFNGMPVAFAMLVAGIVGLHLAVGPYR